MLQHLIPLEQQKENGKKGKIPRKRAGVVSYIHAQARGWVSTTEIQSVSGVWFGAVGFLMCAY